jgi:hypothetical protein
MHLLFASRVRHVVRQLHATWKFTTYRNKPALALVLALVLVLAPTKRMPMEQPYMAFAI